jgi:hypothetical protein
MHLSSEWFVAKAISSIGNGVGSRLAFDAVHRAKHWRSAGSRPDATTHGFTITLRSSPCVAIEDTVGCAAKVLKGKAWITAEGSPHDTIADAGTIVPLARGARFNVSAFSDVATVLITAPSYLTHVGFSFQERDGMRVLAVTSGRGRLAGMPAAITAFARRCFAATRAAAA